MQIGFFIVDELFDSLTMIILSDYSRYIIEK